MIKNQQEQVLFYTFHSFDRVGDVRHGFSTKLGGVSNCFSDANEMNLSFSRGDTPENVTENFCRIARAIGFEPENMVFSDQVHGTNVISVGAGNKGMGFNRKSDIQNADGIMTNERHVVLTTFYADCVPLFFYDPKNHAIALSHAGWKGTLGEIGAATVQAMKSCYGTNPCDIITAIGPSICRECFEVDEPVAAQFYTGLDFAEQYIKKYQIKQDGAMIDKYLIDLQAINRETLICSGVLAENIELPELCTKCNSDIFYSHRVQGSNRGSLAAFLELC